MAASKKNLAASSVVKSFMKTTKEEPSVKRYRDALHVMESSEKLSETARKLFSTLYQFPSHSATASEIAEEMGWKEYRACNLHFGLLGQRVGEQMEIGDDLLKRLADEDGCYGVGPICLLCTFHRPDSNGDTFLTLRPNLVKALEELKLVRNRTTPNQLELRHPFS
jgi:hypothetical protein